MTSLPEIASANAANYQGRAASFARWADGAEAHPAAAVRGIFLRNLPRRKSTPQDKLRVLDLGCGNGRDLAVFAGDPQGNADSIDAVGIDVCEQFCAMARTRVPHARVVCADVTAGLKAALGHGGGGGGGGGDGDAPFHGVFALCSLFHVPRRALPALCAEVFALLAPGGAFLCSFPHSGQGATDDAGGDGRWHTSMPFADLRALLTGAGFDVDLTSGCFPKAVQIYNGTWDVVVGRRPLPPSEHPKGERLLHRDARFDVDAYERRR